MFFSQAIVTTPYKQNIQSASTEKFHTQKLTVVDQITSLNFLLEIAL